jgi:hypothetical protein
MGIRGRRTDRRVPAGAGDLRIAGERWSLELGGATIAPSFGLMDRF